MRDRQCRFFLTQNVHKETLEKVLGEWALEFNRTENKRDLEIYGPWTQKFILWIMDGPEITFLNMTLKIAIDLIPTLISAKLDESLIDSPEGSIL